MGVKGLTKYVFDALPHISISLALGWEMDEETEVAPIRPLVIDASSLLFFIYESTKALDFFAGGEYLQSASVIAHLLQDILHRMKEGLRMTEHEEQESGSSIKKIYLVFDGSSHPEKKETLLKRLQFKINKAMDLWKTKDTRTSPFSLPPFALDVATGAIKAFEKKYPEDVEIVWASAEADRIVAEIASSNRGYILSNDSDFFVYTAKGIQGVCPLNYLKWEKVYEGDGFGKILIPVIRHKDIARRLRVPKSILPLFAVFLGNDALTPKDLEAFHQRLRNDFRFHKLRGIKQVSAFIKRNIPYIHPDLNNEELLAIVRSVIAVAFTDTAVRNKALQVYRSYCFESNEQPRKESILHEQSTSYKCKCGSSNSIFTVIKHRMYRTQQYIENMDITSINSYLAPYRKRIYTWIFFHNKTIPENSTTITELLRVDNRASTSSQSISKSDYEQYFVMTKPIYEKYFPKNPALQGFLQIFDFPPKYVEEVLKCGMPLSYLSLLIALWVLQKRLEERDSWKISAIIASFFSRKKVLRAFTLEDYLATQMPQDADSIPQVSVAQFKEVTDVFDFQTTLKLIYQANTYFGSPLCQDVEWATSSELCSCNPFCILDVILHYSGQNFKNVVRVLNTLPVLQIEIAKLPPRNQEFLSLAHRLRQEKQSHDNIL